MKRVRIAVLAAAFVFSACSDGGSGDGATLAPDNTAGENNVPDSDGDRDGSTTRPGEAPIESATSDNGGGDSNEVSGGAEMPVGRLLTGDFSIDYPDDFADVATTSEFDPEADEQQLLSFASNVADVEAGGGLPFSVIACFVSFEKTAVADLDAHVATLPFSDPMSGVTIVSQDMVEVNGEVALEVVASTIVETAESVSVETSLLGRYYYIDANRSAFGESFAVNAGCSFPLIAYFLSEPKARTVLDSLRID